MGAGIYLPLWAIATLLWVVALVVSAALHEPDGGFLDLSGVVVFFWWIVATFFYMLFWIVYLAIT